jgi:hypothetical protein
MMMEKEKIMLSSLKRRHCPFREIFCFGVHVYHFGKLVVGE